jgi:hypothetical protein
MAWNPSPEVGVARDAAQRFGHIAGSQVTECVVLYVTADRRIGYASYGPTRAMCADAGHLADKLYAAAWRYLAPQANVPVGGAERR